MRGWGDLAELAAAEIVSPDYRELSATDKLSALIANLFPFFQDWLNEWVSATEQDRRFNFRICRHEDFVTNPSLYIKELLEFYGHDVEPVLPEVQPGSKIDTMTHFCRGVVGSHRDEMTPGQLRLVNRLLDRKLFERCE